MDLTRFDPSNQKSQKFFTLMGSFWPKYIIFELKIYREVILHDTEEWCKIWRKTDLPVQNWHEDFDECWPGHSKIPNICTLMCCFWPKYIMSEVKSTEELYLTALKIDAKIEQKLICTSKNDMRNLANFHSPKNSNFILESRMTELNQNKNSKQHAT